MFVNQYKQIWPTLRFCNKRKMKQNQPTLAIWEFCTFFHSTPSFSVFLFLSFCSFDSFESCTFISLWCLKSHSRFEIIKLQRIIDREKSIIYTMQLFSSVYRLSLPCCICICVFFLFYNLPDESSNGFSFSGPILCEWWICFAQKSVRNTKAMKPKRQNKQWHLNENWKATISGLISANGTCISRKNYSNERTHTNAHTQRTDKRVS